MSDNLTEAEEIKKWFFGTELITTENNGDLFRADNTVRLITKFENLIESITLEKDRLKRDLKASQSVGEQLANHTQHLTLEIEELKNLLRETAMRANVCMPTEDIDVQHFEEQFSGSADFINRLFKTLKLGEKPDFENIVAGEKLDKEIENSVYGTCPKCKENRLRCACNLPTWNEIVENAEIKRLKGEIIKFADFIRINKYKHGKNGVWFLDKDIMKNYTTQELYEIFKKQDKNK